MVLAGLVSTAAACGGGAAPGPSPSPVESTPPPRAGGVAVVGHAEAAEEILGAFDAYLTAHVELSRDGVDRTEEDTIARLEGLPPSSVTSGRRSSTTSSPRTTSEGV